MCEAGNTVLLKFQLKENTVLLTVKKKEFAPYNHKKTQTNYLTKNTFSLLISPPISL